MSSTERPLENGWLEDTPIEDTVLRQFLHNQAEMNTLVADAAGGRAEAADGVFLADAGVPVPYFNQAILNRPLRGEDDGVLDEVDAFFYAGGRNVVTMLSIWPTADLASRGWQLVGHPAFVARGPWPDAAGAVDLPAGVEVRTAGDTGALAVAERIAVEGYPIDEARGLPAGTVLPIGLLGSRLVVRLGYVDGEPVAIGNVFVGHGLVNLCLGATLPAARRRGVWESLVRARVADGPGLAAVAYTSDYSRPGFVRMGFLPITRFTLWARMP